MSADSTTAAKSSAFRRPPIRGHANGVYPRHFQVPSGPSTSPEWISLLEELHELSGGDERKVRAAVFNIPILGRITALDYYKKWAAALRQPSVESAPAFAAGTEPHMVPSSRKRLPENVPLGAPPRKRPNEDVDRPASSPQPPRSKRAAASSQAQPSHSPVAPVHRASSSGDAHRLRKSRTHADTPDAKPVVEGVSAPPLPTRSAPVDSMSHPPASSSRIRSTLGVPDGGDEHPAASSRSHLPQLLRSDPCSEPLSSPQPHTILDGFTYREPVFEAGPTGNLDLSKYKLAVPPGQGCFGCTTQNQGCNMPADGSPANTCAQCRARHQSCNATAPKKAEVFVRGGKLPSASRTAAAAASVLHSSPLLVEWATVREGQNLLCRQMAVTSALCTAAIHEGALAMHNMNHLRERANAILQRVASGSSKDDSGPQ
ncbi:hypothetical protein PHLGIDRAFT_17192 [Phlebiopsis gigantea 11061_1 CR5-6]|uniref:Uncharacterized protein n=1 Tax=Phlebiopsis gigantea (strain 11061_1 CR5-6) TaxID=745531 RepID=A0A0C3S1P8_PHLG1|nr:hypothetical protein PHLGIDRAFT_17192 [Phlebiopsis gigantea 11061_1 CR5-6]